MSRAEQIKRIRRELLVSLKAIYPAAMESQVLLRAALLPLFPDLEFDHLRQDLAYLVGKGYIKRAMPKDHDHPEAVPWRYRWFALTPEGVEIADRVRTDEALEV